MADVAPHPDPFLPPSPPQPSGFFGVALETLAQQGGPHVLPGGRWVFTPESQIALLQANRASAVEWAQAALASPDTLFLDVETTGLVDAEVVQLTLVDNEGRLKFHRLFRPLHRIPWDASKANGIYQTELEGLPTIAASWGEIAALISGKNIVCYNAEFDHAALMTSALRHRLKSPQGYQKPAWYCAMWFCSLLHSSFRLWKLQEAAEEEGLPYQRRFDPDGGTLPVFALVQAIAAKDPLEVTLSNGGWLSSKRLEAINAAIRREQPLRFLYETSVGKLEFAVLPRALYQSGEGLFYLYGLVGDRSQGRTFRLDRAEFPEDKK